MSSTESEKTPAQYRYRFGTAEFDTARFELRISGLPVEVQRKPLEILAQLLARAGEVVTREELLDIVWHGRPTVDNVVANAVAKLRSALGEENAARISTLPRVGYRFDGPVERMAVGRSVPGSRLALVAGQPVPGRSNFQLEALVGGTVGSEVWLARHTRTRERRVYKFSADGDQLAALKREATLSRLLHDNLGDRRDFVRVLDWNFESPPFFLESEYAGVDLARWAEESSRLSQWPVAQRLALFLQIADAVAAAHGVGVLHKDLKPANVLLAQADGEDSWHVRLADFGSSRLLEPGRLDELGITRLGLTVTGSVLSDSNSGTPLYLAPELITGGPPTIASDVYALGIMLYQLVVGDLRRPLVPGWERGVADPLLCVDIAAATDGDPSLRIASVPELTKRLRALDERRAAEQQRQAAQVEAAAAREALQRARARRPWVYASFAAMAIGVVASGLFWQRSAQQRHVAEQHAARAEATIRFLSDDLIGAMNPGSAGFERDPTIRDMLDFASTQLPGRLPEDPAVRGSIRAALGQAWRNLGERERGAEELRSAVADYTASFGAADDTTLRTRYALVHTLAYATRFDEARQELDAADALAGQRLKQPGELALAAVVARGVFHFQQLQIAPALAAWQQADELQRRLRPDDAHLAVAIREALADATLRQGKLEEAVAQLRQNLADPLLEAGRVGENRVAAQRVLLARALRNLGRYHEALPIAQQAVSVTERLSGPDDYATLTQMSLLASIHDYADDCPRALDIMRTVRSRMAKRYGDTRQGTLVETGNLGLKEFDCGDREAGIGYIRQAEQGLRTHYGENNVTAQIFGYTLAGLLVREKRWKEAQAMVERLDVEALTAGNSRPGWAHRLNALQGEILIGLGQAVRGRELLAAALPELDALGTEEEEDLARLRGLLAAR